MAPLPYVTSPGNIEKALTGIKEAATPKNVNQDFVKTILKIPGGSGNQMAAYLKKIGFVRPDGSPTDIYSRFRNPSSEGAAAAEALKIGYALLSARIDYTTFGHLSGIITNNWDLFSTVFKSQKAVQKVMSSLNLLRGPIAHCCPLSDDEIDRLQLTVKDWFRMMG
jgi:hypothetical protein